jgi:hypothetical protein
MSISCPKHAIGFGHESCDTQVLCPTCIAGWDRNRPLVAAAEGEAASRCRTPDIIAERIVVYLFLEERAASDQVRLSDEQDDYRWLYPDGLLVRGPRGDAYQVGGRCGLELAAGQPIATAPNLARSASNGRDVLRRLHVAACGMCSQKSRCRNLLKKRSDEAELAMTGPRSGPLSTSSAFRNVTSSTSRFLNVLASDLSRLMQRSGRLHQALSSNSSWRR